MAHHDAHGHYDAHGRNDTHGNKQTVLSAGSLTGTRVVNGMGDELGSITELMLHSDSGEVAYAVVSFGGFLGMGNKLFAVPWKALAVDTVNEQITLDVPHETLESAEGFDKNDWPQSLDETWFANLHRHYGQEYAGRRH